jgi:bacillithiol synthase
MDDYTAHAPALAPFFFGAPFDADAYRRKADEVRSRFDPGPLAAVGDAIRATDDDAARKLRAVSAGQGFLVTTGQQPGLFGGPLYTIHKALSAIALARRLEAVLETPVLPVFWIASDDHDWDEANHVHLLDTGNELHRLALDGEPAWARSMGRRALGGGAEKALSELDQILPRSDFTPQLLERLRAAYSGSGKTVAGAFARTLEGLFEGVSMGFVDAQDPVIRRQGREVIRRELAGSEAHERALAEQTARLEAAGYEAQVPILPGASNVFYEDEEHGRERLLREDGGWVLRRSKRRLSQGELEGLEEEWPERFSANVVLRPVLESAVLPTLAYVAGPGETRYLAQTGCLFQAHGVAMPLVFPRFGVTLIEAKVEKVLGKFGLDADVFAKRPVHELVAEAVREDVPEGVTSAVGHLRQSLQEGYEAVFEAAKEIDPTLKGPIFQARNDGFKALSEVEKKIRQHVKLQEETHLEQLEKAAVNLAPGGKPQERVLNVHQYLARYGEALLPAILERMEVRLDSDGTGWRGVRCAS